jgi:predicted nucleic acid-binding protein
MIVVADTTPIRYLVGIEREHLLPALYGRVLIPPAVAAELDPREHTRCCSRLARQASKLARNPAAHPHPPV